MDRKICLVTGGSGFLGINLIRRLLTRGFAVRSIDIAPFDYPESNSVDARLDDIRSAAAVDRAMAGAEVVVHCAAALPRSTPADIHSTDVEGTRILLTSARRHRVSRFIFISSTSVYGIPDHHPILESDALHGVGPYGSAKIEAEKACREARQQGLCVPILRPKTFVGPERLGVFELLYDWAYRGRNFPVLGSGNNLYQFLDVADLCDVIELCIDRDAATVDDTFNVGAQDFGTLREAFQAVLDRAGRAKRVISIPARPALAALRLLEALHLSPLYEWIYETSVRDSHVSIARLKERLGYVPRYSNRDALMRNYDWYIQHRDEYRGKSGLTHRVPWKRGALALVGWLL